MSETLARPSEHSDEPSALDGGMRPPRRSGLRSRTHFGKTIIFGLLALIVLVVGVEIDGLHTTSLRWRLVTYGCAALTGTLGVLASRSAAQEVHRLAVGRAGDVAAMPLRLTVLLGGYLIVVAAVCSLLGLDLRQLLVGGAITGVIVGLAAQPVLGNLFAGLVLLFARPYLPGQQIRVLTGSINGPLTGCVTSAGLLYTVLETTDGPLNIPNSALLAAAVGPASTGLNEPSTEPDKDSTLTDSDSPFAAAAIAAVQGQEKFGSLR